MIRSAARALTAIALTLPALYVAPLSLAQEPSALDQQQTAFAKFQAQKKTLEQRLTDERNQNLSEDSPEVRDTEDQLLTLVGEQLEANEAEFAHSKGLFSTPNVYKIPVLYVTDRQRSAQGDFVGSSLPKGKLEYGVALSTIKSDVAFRTDFVADAAMLSQDTKVSPPATRVLSGMPALLAEIAARKTDPTGKPRRVLLFIHGYNNSFDAAVEDAARLASEVQFSTIPIAYSWPSADRLGKYGQDADQVKISEVSFGEFLAELVSKSPVEVVVVAHSMGSRLLTSGLFHLTETNAPHPQLHRVIYAAADIAQDDLTRHVEKSKFRDVNFTFYSSTHDFALILSSALHTFQRLGDASQKVLAVDGADCVDASRVDSVFKAVGHSYVFNSPAVDADIAKWIDSNQSPAARGLVGIPSPAPRYYVFP